MPSAVSPVDDLVSKVLVSKVLLVEHCKKASEACVLAHGGTSCRWGTEGHEQIPGPAVDEQTPLGSRPQVNVATPVSSEPPTPCEGPGPMDCSVSRRIRLRAPFGSCLDPPPLAFRREIRPDQDWPFGV